MKVPKGTSRDSDFSFESKIESLGLSVQKMWHVQEAMTDGRTDGRTTQVYRPQSEGLGPKNAGHMRACNENTESRGQIREYWLSLK